MTFGMPFLLETPTVEEAASLCRELGLAFVELNMNFPACVLESLDPQQLLELKKQYGIYFTLHMEEDFDPFHFNGSVRRAWLESLRRTLVLAQMLKAPIVNMHMAKGVYITLPEERVYLYHRCKEEYLAAVHALRDLCEAELLGTATRIAVENTAGFAPHEREALEILLASPVFGLTLDIGHSHAVGDCDLPFFQKHSDRLIHMHGHDAKGKSNHLALGDGEIDLPARFAWAGKNNARIVLETKTIAALRQSLAWLEQSM